MAESTINPSGIQLPERSKGVKKKRFLQKARILRNLYVHGPASNADISRRLNISPPTSLQILKELLSDRFIEKQGEGESKGGRKPVLFGLRKNSFYVLAVEMARFKTKMAILDNTNQNITGTHTYNIDIKKSDEVLGLVCKNASVLTENSGIDKDKLIGAGVIMPGLIDSVRGINYTHLNFGSKTTREVFEEKLKYPVLIENDAKVMAHAELRFGKARGRKNVLVVFLEWGLGLGIIIDGKIYRGALGFAGELSHIPAVDNEIYCQCGNRGCLETIASGAAIARMAKEEIDNGKSSIMSYLKGVHVEDIETEQVVEAANRGDLCAIRILSEVGMNLGRELASLIQLMNPEVIILSGKVCEARNYITTPVQQALNTYCMPQLRQNTDVVISELGSDHGILGAASMTMEYLFDRPFLTNWYGMDSAVKEKRRNIADRSMKLTTI